MADRKWIVVHYIISLLGLGVFLFIAESTLGAKMRKFLPYIRHYIFLTQASHLFETVYYLLGIVFFAIVWMKPKVKVQSFRSFLQFFYVLCLTISFVVLCAFWSLFFLDRELIYSKKAEESGLYPFYLNIFQHLIAPFILWADLLINRECMNLDKKNRDAFFSLVFLALYFGMSMGVGMLAGWFPYPFLKAFNTWQLLVFVVGGGASAALFAYAVARGIYRWKWRKELTEPHAKKN